MWNNNVAAAWNLYLDVVSVVVTNVPVHLGVWNLACKEHKHTYKLDVDYYVHVNNYKHVDEKKQWGYVRQI